MASFVSEYLWWVSSCVLFAALAVLLYAKGVYIRFPIFTAWLCAATIETNTLLILDRFAPLAAYNQAFWGFAILDVALQVAVVYEFALRALRHDRQWLAGAPLRLGGCFLLAGVLATAMGAFAAPAVLTTSDLFYTRFELSTSVLVFAYASCCFVLSYSAGTLWPKAELTRFLGFLTWSGASLAVDTLHVYWRTRKYFDLLEWSHGAVNCAVLIFWLRGALRFTSAARLRNSGVIGALHVNLAEHAATRRAN